MSCKPLKIHHFTRLKINPKKIDYLPIFRLRNFTSRESNKVIDYVQVPGDTVYVRYFWIFHARQDYDASIPEWPGKIGIE